MTHRSHQTPLTHASLTCSYILCDTLCAFQAYCLSLLLNTYTVASGRNFFVSTNTERIKLHTLLLSVLYWSPKVLFHIHKSPNTSTSHLETCWFSLSLCLSPINSCLSHPSWTITFFSYLRLLIRIFTAAFYEVQCSLKQHYSTFVFSVFIFKSFS